MAPASERPTGVATGRLVTGIVVLPLLMAAGVGAVWTGLRDRLPDPLATHWGLDGRPNGSMSLGGFAAFVVALALLFWGIGVAVLVGARHSPARFRAERAVMAAVVAVEAFLAALTLVTLLVNVDETATSAELPLVTIVPVLAVSALAGMVAYVLAGRPPPRATAADVERLVTTPVLTLAPGDTPVWHATLSSRVLLGAGVATTVGAAIVAWQWSWWPALVLLLVALACLALSSAHVTVDVRGLTVGLGPLGWPRKHISPADVERATAGDIEPTLWGGWGYRVLPGKSAVVLRRGPGIVVDQRDGRQFAVTVDAPEDGAALLDAYARRTRTTT